MAMKVNATVYGNSFTVVESEYKADKFDLNNVRLIVRCLLGYAGCQTANVQFGILRGEMRNFRSTQSMTDWTRTLNQEQKWAYNLESVRGGTGRGTYANQTGLFAYLSWLCSQFEIAVMETAVLAAEGDGEGAVMRMQTAAVREDNKSARKDVVGLIAKHHQFTDFRRFTNGFYKELFDMDSSEIKESRKAPLGKRGNPLKNYSATDVMDDDELLSLTAGYAMTALMVRKKPETSLNSIVSKVGGILVEFR